MRAQKRVKYSHRSETNSASKPRSENIGVRPEDLKWSEVAPPDHLESYEGFLGLQEIEDVDVIQTEHGKTFCPRTVQISQSNDDEWAGFESDDQAATEKPFSSRSVKNKGKIAKVTDEHLGEVSYAALLNDKQDQDVDLTDWNFLKLSPRLLSALSKLEFRSPTPVQRAAIPHILEGHDVIGKAPTGSGKTLAFGLPIFNFWLELRTNSKREVIAHHPVALIILPTRELAHQITSHLEAFTYDETEISPRIATLTGGLSLQKQTRQIEQADFIVSTPGRLWDMIESGQAVLNSLRRINFLVVDEADRLLSAGHFKELQQILDALDRQTFDEKDNVSNTTSSKITHTRQTLVFSATFHKALQQKLSKRMAFGSNESLYNVDSMFYLLERLNFREARPKFIDINPISQMVNGLREGLIQCPRSTDKDLYLYSVIALYYSKNRSLVFVNSISAVRRLVPFLQNLNQQALGLHSRMQQKARLRSIERFSEASKGIILVATDVAARGLDIPHIEIIIHYHVPRTADVYVHRCGRTARACRTGSSILIYAPEEAGGVQRLISQVHSNIRNDKGRGTKSLVAHSLHVDSRIVAKLEPRVVLSKKLSDAAIAKEKWHTEDEILRNGAKDLGVDYSSDEFQNPRIMKGRGRSGHHRKIKEKEARGLTKAELQELRSELKANISRGLIIGVSARYLTATGSVDIDKLSKEHESGAILGNLPDLGWEDQ